MTDEEKLSEYVARLAKIADDLFSLSNAISKIKLTIDVLEYIDDAVDLIDQATVDLEFELKKKRRIKND